MVRTKPIPAYRRTLPQVYQRWLYEDYAYLWTQQSQAVKQLYAAAGVRHHLTGFQYWMKIMLSTMPDISGWWKLDEKAGPVAYDSGRNLNHGTIIGALPTDGLIDGAFSFDGLNDRIIIPTSPSLQGYAAKTVITFLYVTAFTGATRGIYEHSTTPIGGGDFMYLRHNVNLLYFYLVNSLGASVTNTYFYTPPLWLCAAYTWDGTTVIYYINGIDIGGHDALTGTLECNAFDLYIGSHRVASWFDNLLDNFIIFNRGLDPTEIARWAERRYPA